MSVRVGTLSPSVSWCPHLYNEQIKPDDLEGLQFYEMKQNFIFGWNSVQKVSEGAVLTSSKKDYSPIES